MNRLRFDRVLPLTLAVFWGVSVCAHAQTKPRSPRTASVDLAAAQRATTQLYVAQPPMAPPPPATTMTPAEMASARPPLALSGLAAPPTAWPSAPQPASAIEAPVKAATPLSRVDPIATPSAEVWQGVYECGSADKVVLRPGAGAAQVELQWGKQRWRLQRMDSRSGVLRLEDAGARLVWIQLPHKSMLLDQKQGQRLLDDCQHAEQVLTAAHMGTKYPAQPALFDTRGMGR